jgi:glycosyltransferase involved in cell wall biosynthesis
MRFSIIITGYNAEDYVRECLDSVYAQTFTDFEVIILDDGSTDNTRLLIEANLHYGWGFLSFKDNLGALDRRELAVNTMTNGEIIVFLGLDDMLTPNCLEVLDKVYTPEIKMAYGSWMTPQRQGYLAREYPQEVFDNKSFRTHEWLATNPNSFRVELLCSVPIDVLIDEDGNFFKNCTDLAYSFPCLEQCKKNEVAVVKEFIYIYNHNHPNTTLNRLGKEHKTKVREYLKTIKPV